MDGLAVRLGDTQGYGATVSGGLPWGVRASAGAARVGEIRPPGRRGGYLVGWVDQVGWTSRLDPLSRRCLLVCLAAAVAATAAAGGPCRRSSRCAQVPARSWPISCSIAASHPPRGSARADSRLSCTSLSTAEDAAGLWDGSIIACCIAAAAQHRENTRSMVAPFPPQELNHRVAAAGHVRWHCTWRQPLAAHDAPKLLLLRRSHTRRSPGGGGGGGEQPLVALAQLAGGDAPVVTAVVERVRAQSGHRLLHIRLAVPSW
jgi:hypothetical protein